MNPKQLGRLLGGRGRRQDRFGEGLPDIHSLVDLRRAAGRRLPRAIFDYLEGGAEQERTVRANLARYDGCRFHPRALTGSSTPDLSLTLFGDRLPLPVGLAPTGYTRLIHREGEIAVARAAGRLGVPYAAATMANTALGEIAAAAPGPLWFQLYASSDWAVTEQLVGEAERAGCRALLLSVDTQVAGQRLRDLRNGLTIPPSASWRALLGIALRAGYSRGLLSGPELGFANFEAPSAPSSGGIAQITRSFEASLAWEHLHQLRQRWHGALLLKGPLGPSDVARAVAEGCDGVYLSNHGGRQLDRTAHPLDLLAAARREVGQQVALLVDSGIRSGADVAIALGLGADLCLVGRPYLYGLAAAGERGVGQVIKMIRDELERTMHLLGVGGVRELRQMGSSLVSLGGDSAGFGLRS